MTTMFDKGLSIRMGQAHVERRIPDLLPLAEAEDDPLGTMDLATHHVALDAAPGAYRDFRAKNDGWSSCHHRRCVRVNPVAARPGRLCLPR